MQRDLRSRKFPLMERLERIGRKSVIKEEVEEPVFNKFSFNSLSLFEDEPVIEEKPKQKNFTRLGLLKERKYR